MDSRANTPPDKGELAGADGISQRILAATISSLTSSGPNRTTMERVAEIAGIGVATVYRRFARKDNLIQQALLYEAEAFLSELVDTIAILPTMEEQIAEAFVAFIRETRRRPLLRGIAAGHALNSLPLVASEGALVVKVGREYVSQMIVGWQRAGRLSDFDPNPAAEVFARIAHSLVISPGGVIPIDDEEKAREFAVTYLLPVITGHAADAATRSPTRNP